MSHEICLLLLVLCSRSLTTLCSDERHQLPVLLLLPYPNSSPQAGWDRGLELLPAARVALKEINNMTDLLPGYRIKLIERPSDACGVSMSFLGLTNFVEGVFPHGQSNSTNALAVLGLACSTVTSAVSPIAAREQVSLIQIAIANSHFLRNQTKFPHLWRVVSAVTVKIDAAISLMQKFNWTRIAQIYDGNGVFFQSSATFFRKVLASNDKYNLVLDQAIDEDISFIQSSIRLIQENAARIIFVSATVPEAKLLMCEAAKANLVWPGYVWIFHSRTSEELIDPSCDFDNIVRAVENVTLLDLNLQRRSENDVLVSGRTYGEYMNLYQEELKNIYLEFESYNYNFMNNHFANAMYDELWALALALNASLSDLRSRSLRLENYQYNMSEITEIIENHLKDVTFQGAVNKVKFNNLREAQTPVSLFHIRNGTKVEIGQYDDNGLMLYNTSAEMFPDDDFVLVYNLLSKGILITFIALTGFAILLTTLVVVAMFLLYNTPEVRAASPVLSLLVFSGCYLLIFSSPLFIIRQSFQLERSVYDFICVFELWLLEIGHCLIVSTLLLRLVRVYKIFRGFARIGKIWKDKYLFLFSILLSSVPTIIYIVWLPFDPIFYNPSMETRNDLNPPAIIITPACDARNNYNGLGFLLTVAFYIAGLIVLLLVYAFRTRKIDNRHGDFKDTKKLILFIYVFAVILNIQYGLFFTLRTLGFIHAITIVMATANILEAILVLVFLYIPKIVPSAYRRMKGKRDTITHLTTSDGSL